MDGELSSTPLSYLKMGASTIGNDTPISQLSTIEAQLIPGGLVSKIAMGASVLQPPHISGAGVSTIKHN